MSNKSILTNQRGVILLGLLIFIFFMGMIILSLLTLLTAEARLQVLDINKKRALYAAHSGIEYAMRSINEYAVTNSNLFALNNYKEDIKTGSGTHCVITIQTNGKDKLIIKAVGYSKNFTKVIEKRVDYIDIAKWAVYATGKVKYIKTIPSGKIYQNAKYLPLFDKDYLIKLAKPNNYYPSNLYLNSVFSFIKDIAFVEKNLTFGVFNWMNVGNFVVGGNVRIKSSWLIFGSTSGTIYQFNPNSQFLCEWQFIWRSLNGGIITNGNVIGTNKPFFSFRFRVYYNRSKITSLLRYSVNGGPLIYNSARLIIY